MDKNNTFTVSQNSSHLIEEKKKKKEKQKITIFEIDGYIYRQTPLVDAFALTGYIVYYFILKTIVPITMLTYHTYSALEKIKKEPDLLPDYIDLETGIWLSAIGPILIFLWIGFYKLEILVAKRGKIEYMHLSRDIILELMIIALLYGIYRFIRWYLDPTT